MAVKKAVKKVGAVKAVKEVLKKEPGRADVVYRGNQVRTYWEDVHGEKYMELAKEFAEKFGGRIL
jgi:hypothetical protein